MVNRLEYDKKLDKAMRYIFGRTLICRNLEIATNISKQYNLDCITIDGDQVSIQVQNFRAKKSIFNWALFNRYRPKVHWPEVISKMSDQN